MANYMIHTCLQRMWYVNHFLVPSMLAQGIIKSDITLYIDSLSEGCLESTMKSFEGLKDKPGTTWHLQDDVIICSDFKKRTEYFSDEIVACGFCSEYDRGKPAGVVPVTALWYSFPCILIQNSLAVACAKWFRTTARHMELYKLFVRAKKYDDTFFNEYMRTQQSEVMGINIVPNLVNHVDYLIGGSVVNEQRAESKIVAEYWDEPELIKELEEQLVKKKR